MRSLGLSSLMQHSVQVGSYSRCIARTAGVSRQAEEVAFTAGLLHDVGRVILATSLSDQYRQVNGLLAHERMTVFEAEE